MPELHESPTDVSQETRELHRALRSLIEELEAIDWYQQRVDATQDAELRGMLAHNRDEEVEHACMTLEWVRRHSQAFDRQLRRYLFRDGPIVDEKREAPPRGGDGSLGLGRLSAEAAD